jgi:hypothetical protein
VGDQASRRDSEYVEVWEDYLERVSSQVNMDRAFVNLGARVEHESLGHVA